MGFGFGRFLIGKESKDGMWYLCSQKTQGITKDVLQVNKNLMEKDNEMNTNF